MLQLNDMEMNNTQGMNGVEIKGAGMLQLNGAQGMNSVIKGTVRGPPISDSTPTPAIQLRPWLRNSDSAHSTPITSTDRLLIVSLVALA